MRKGDILIIDNFAQPQVWMPLPHVVERLLDYEVIIYPQADHVDWQSAVVRRK